MDWIKKAAFASLLVSLLFLVNSCSMKLGLAPISSIDYTKVKTISIADFQNRAEYVYAPLATEFNQVQFSHRVPAPDGQLDRSFHYQISIGAGLSLPARR